MLMLLLYCSDFFSMCQATAITNTPAVTVGCIVTLTARRTVMTVSIFVLAGFLGQIVVVLPSPLNLVG